VLEGAGEYDEACTLLRALTGAAGVAVIVYGGHRGNGFSVQAPPVFIAALPGILRDMAGQMERDAAAGTPQDPNAPNG
jgi:hypothetical protein